jgi:hypothetical protein
MSEQIKMTLITPPDTLQNENVSVLLVNPSDQDKDSFNTVAKDLKNSINLYLFDEETHDDPSWLIDVAQSVDYIIVNIDHSRKIEWLIAWLLNFSKTFYLTTKDHMPYNKINVNKVYDISQVAEGVNYFEERKT